MDPCGRNGQMRCSSGAVAQAVCMLGCCAHLVFGTKRRCPSLHAFHDCNVNAVDHAKGSSAMQEQRQVAAAEAGNAKQVAQQLLALARTTGQVTEAYEARILHQLVASDLLLP